MRRRIADWAYSFWYNNHTHNWELYEPTMNWEKCRYCGKVQNFKQLHYEKTNVPRRD